MDRRQERAYVGLGLTWLVLVSAGMGVLIDYGSAPGDPGLPPREWPVDCPIPRTPGRATLIFWAHPHCPCTRASLGELGWIMSHGGARLDAFAVFVKPSGLPEQWARSELSGMAAAIPGIHVVQDDRGSLARSFHIATSGHALLYDGRGRLEFSGGITGARGHEGGNVGRYAVVSFLRNGQADRAESPVFGCALSSPKVVDKGNWRPPWKL